ncbi:hypothetical protein KR222_008494, partial [Zaprionus bogoriensis]
MHHFHTQVSRKALRVGDNYTIACWADSLSLLQQLGIGTYELSLQRTTGELLQFRPLANGTGIYAQLNAEHAKHKREYGYSCMWCNLALHTAYFEVLARLTVEDFDCRFLYYGVQSLNCSFIQPGRGYYLDRNARFALLYNSKEYGCQTGQGDDGGRVHCQIPHDQYKYSKHYNLSVIQRDKLGEQQSQQFSFEQAECLVLPPAGLNNRTMTQRVNATAICLEWENKQKEHEPSQMHWEIGIVGQPQLKLSWTSVSTEMMTREAYCLTGLPLPNWEYTLTARRRLKHPHAHFSELFEHTFRTLPLAPSRPPTLWVGGYSLDAQQPRQLNVFWQQLELRERNGPQFKYSVSVWRLPDKAVVRDLTIKVEPNMATIDNLDTANGQYEVLVRSQNSVGLSANSSSLVIDKLEISALRLPQKLVIDKKAQRISWTAPLEQADLRSYRIFWCIADTSDHARCDDSQRIESVEASADYDHFESANVKNDSYRWAVSASYGYGSACRSGGMVWRDPGTLYIQDDADGRLSMHGIEGVLALLVLGLCFYALFWKYQHCSGIDVDLPPGV